MIFRKHMWKKALLLFLVLLLLVPVLAACDDDDDEDDTPKGTAQTTQPASGDSDASVNIAAICAWSGYGAGAGWLADSVVELVSWQVEQKGGIQIGDTKRPLDIIKYDMKSDVAGATQAATKAITQDDCVALAMGGLTGADGIAIADVAEDHDVLYSHYMGDATLATDFENTINAVLSMDANIIPASQYIIDVLKPESVVFLGQESSMEHLILDGIEELTKAAGIKTKAKIFYPSETVDFMPQLTNIRRENPDLVICYGAMRAYQAMYDQMRVFGGWTGDIEFFGVSQSAGGKNVVESPGAEGTYCTAYWEPSLVDNPGTQQFVNDWKAYAAEHSDFASTYGDMPSVNNLPFYHTLWVAIQAVEKAGSDDPAAVVAAARSGNLTWESPAGMLTWNAMGESDQVPLIAQVTDDNRLNILRFYDE